MKIIIVGCGKVGYAIAGQLAQEKHDIVMVDNEIAHLSRADDCDFGHKTSSSHWKGGCPGGRILCARGENPHPHSPLSIASTVMPFAS